MAVTTGMRRRSTMATGTSASPAVVLRARAACGTATVSSQPTGVHIPQNRGTRIQLGWSITHHRLPLGLHGLEGLASWSAQLEEQSPWMERPKRMGRQTGKMQAEEQVLRQEVGLSKVQKSGLIGTEQRQVLLVLGAMQDFARKKSGQERESRMMVFESLKSWSAAEDEAQVACSRC